MGRKRKNKKHYISISHPPKKKQKQDLKKKRKTSIRKLWIETCSENVVDETGKLIPTNKKHQKTFTIVLTQSELSDDFMQHLNETTKQKRKKSSSNEQNKKPKLNSAESSPDVPQNNDNHPQSIKSNEEFSKNKNREEETQKEEKLSVNSENVPTNDESSKNITYHKTFSEKEQPHSENDANLHFKIIRGGVKDETYCAKYKKELPILPNGDSGDGVKNPFPTNEVHDKYWAQRKRLFSRFDEGIRLDKESWYSVTPEVIAKHIAGRLIREKDVGLSFVVLDAFSGCGGNAIAFAQNSSVTMVVCVDIDRKKLEMASHNASIYGIAPHKLVFVVADAVTVLSNCYKNGNKVTCTEECLETTEKTEHGYRIGGCEILPPFIDTVFLSPPWGGIDYEKFNRYDIKRCIRIASPIKVTDGAELLAHSIAAVPQKTQSVIYFLPRNIDGVSLGVASWKDTEYGGTKIEMEQNLVNGKFKTVTVYYRKESHSDMSVMR